MGAACIRHSLRPLVFRARPSQHNSGIEPTVIRQPGIAMDIDHPVDLALFLRLPQSAGTRTRTLLDELGVPALLAARGIG